MLTFFLYSLSGSSSSGSSRSGSSRSSRSSAGSKKRSNRGTKTPNTPGSGSDAEADEDGNSEDEDWQKTFAAMKKQYLHKAEEQKPEKKPEKRQNIAHMEVRCCLLRLSLCAKRAVQFSPKYLLYCVASCSHILLSLCAEPDEQDRGR